MFLLGCGEFVFGVCVCVLSGLVCFRFWICVVFAVGMCQALEKFGVLGEFFLPRVGFPGFGGFCVGLFVSV